MPHEPTGKLREQLQQEDQQARLEATRNLLESAGRPRADLLVPQLRDASRAVQDAAAEQLIAQRDPDSVPLLLPLLAEDEAPLRNLAADILGKIFPEGVEHAALAWDELDDDARILLVEALGASGSAHGLDVIARAAASDNTNVRNASAMALGRLGSVEVLPHLLKLLRDQDEWVRFSAIESLCQLEDSSVFPQLVRALHDARDKPWYAGVLACFIELKRPEAIPVFLEEIASVDQAFHAEICAVLVELFELADQISVPDRVSARARPALIALLSHQDPWVAFRATSVLAHLPSDDARAALIGALQSERDLVRAGACKALAKIAGASDLPALEDASSALGDDAPEELDALIQRLQSGGGDPA